MQKAMDAALVRIRSKDGEVVGSGFLVEGRQVLTCTHVVAQALGYADDTVDLLSSQVQLDFPQLVSHTLLLAKVILWLPIQSDRRGDIALLELLADPPIGAQPAHLVQTDQVWGHTFRALGFPHGYDDGVWATGRLLGRQGTRLIQLEDIKTPGIFITSGFDGSPVWDEQLQGVVGMVVLASQATTTKIAFAIPSDVLIISCPQLVSRPSAARNPYKGLQAFAQADTRDFFGRDAQIDALALAIEEMLSNEQKGESAARLLAVLGASGAGKSSVVMAGLVPHLRAGGILNSQDWVYLDPIIPGADPLEALVIALKPYFPDISIRTLHENLEENVPRGLHLLARQLVNKPGQRVILLIDQFEEIFTLTIDEAKRRKFFDLLVAAATEPHAPFYVILTLRADLYDRPMQYRELYRLIDEHHVSVLPMGWNELRSVIEGPAHLPEVQLTFEKGLVEEVLFAVDGQSGKLPLLEFTLDQLVRHRDGQQLTLRAYHEMGEVKGALSQYAEEVYQGLPSAEHREAARNLFLRLIHPGITEQDATRRRAQYTEFEQADAARTGHMQEILERFIQARLLTSNRVSGIHTIEVSHEALIREWKSLTAWLNTARADILFQESLSEDASEWEQRKRPRDRLYRGVQFKEARAWASRNSPNKQEAAFLKAGAAQQTLQFAIIVVVVISLISSLVTAGFFVALNRAIHPDPTLITTLQDNVNGSLRYCIENAPTGSTIRFAQGLHGTIILQESLSFLTNRHLTIQGPGAGQLTISGAKDSNTHIIVPLGATLTLAGLSFKNGQTIIYAFIENRGALTIAQSIISNNSNTAGATSFGGGIFNGDTGIMMVRDSTFSGNSSDGDQSGLGGALDNQGKLTVVRSTFSQNTAIGGSSDSLGGGAIFNNEAGTVMVSDSTFSGNSSKSEDADGGGIANDGKLTVVRSTFSQNTVASTNNSSLGGAIYNNKTGTATVSDSTFSGNSSPGKQEGYGGAIDNQGKLTVVRNTFAQNTAVSTDDGSFGGAIYNSKTGTVTVSDSTFSGNSSHGKQSGQGGAIANVGKLTIVGNTFAQNTAISTSDTSFGGGIFNDDIGTMTVSNSTFFSNSSHGQQGGQGGAIDNDGKLTIVGNTFAQNTAVSTSNNSFGGAIDNYKTGVMTMSNSLIAANTAISGPDISGSLISGGYNLLTNTAEVSGLNTRTDKQVTIESLNLDTILRNNGGPTQTLALLAGSSAINVIPLNACHITFTDASGQTETLTTDQRGIKRPDGSKKSCASGAYEFVA